MVLIPTAKSSAASSNSSSDGLTVFQKAIADAISAAAGTGLRSCSVSVSGKAVLDVQKTLNLLNNILGYSSTLSGTTMTITW